MTRGFRQLGAAWILAAILGGGSHAGVRAAEGPFWDDWDMEVHGFAEARAGTRLQRDPYEKDASILESRLQLDVSAYPSWGDIVVKGDGVGDAVLEKGDFDLREANVALRPLDAVDLKLGRQILTWGTGDLVFINDLFPKDWQSFFIGRDTEYLKAPSDAVKVGVFGEAANLDLVYSPQFDGDRIIRGERLSYWNSNQGRLAGRDALVTTRRRDQYFRDDEVAARAYRNVGSTELALYGYWGYWKSPGGQTAAGVARFPRLNVYGASARGPVGPGIGNAEFGYYDSAEDRAGSDGLVNNSEIRYLLGYTQEAARDFTVGLQYYVEQMLDFGGYLAGMAGRPSRDEFRHLLTLRLTRLALNQNLRLSLFTYYSPSDRDTYLRPIIHYKATDSLALEAGANLFAGEDDHSFFGQFRRDTNLYTALRYGF